MDSKFKFCLVFYSSLTSCTQPACVGDVGDWVIINVYFEMWDIVQVVSVMVTNYPFSSQKLKLGAMVFLFCWGQGSTSIPNNF